MHQVARSEEFRLEFGVLLGKVWDKTEKNINKKS
jgi:hypothetical protein